MYYHTNLTIKTYVMRKLRFNLLLVLLPALFVFASCGGAQKTDDNKKAEVEQPKDQIVEADVLLSYIEKTGDFINSPAVPAMIKSTEVKENIGNEKYLVIDMRKHDDYVDAHISGAVNVPQSKMLNYLTNDCQPGNYDKIAIVCYTGQSASYVTSVLRLMGYANVYAMKWGMSSWAPKFAEAKWLKNIGSAYQDKLETTANEMPSKGALPTITTGKTDGMEILEARAAEVLSTPFKKAVKKAEAIGIDPTQYYIINYWPKEKYDTGHLPGAVQYNPKKSLSRAAQLATLPTDKPIVTYCFTGQHSAFVTAYLRMLGYDAYSLIYGANSFMNEKMVAGGKPWNGFTKKEIHDYPTVSGENATDGAKADSKAPVKKATAKEDEEGGC